MNALSAHAYVDEARRPARSQLRTALDEVLAASSPVPRRTRYVDVRPSEYASSFGIEELDVCLDDGSRLALVCKDTSRTAMLPQARRIKPAFLHDPLREITTYDTILGPFHVGAPRFYGARVDKRRGHYWLFLERVMGPPLTEVGDFDVWLQVSAWLARMHGRVCPCATFEHSRLVRFDAALYRRWMCRAERFLQSRPWEARSRQIRFRWLASRYESVIERLAALPVGFIHGEFYPSNVLVDGLPGGVRVRPLDWELAGIGPRLLDLAALTAGSWTDEQKRELAFSYYAELESLGHAWLGRDEFMRALDCCRLQLAVQYLGWAREWVPPANHAQDWLGEALRMADRIGV
jgi:hypothetical protein